MAFRGSNIALDRVLREEGATDYEVATYKGVSLKTTFFLILTVVGAFSGIFLLVNNIELFTVLLPVSIIGTTVLAIISFIFPNACKITGSLYCFFEGFFVGVVSFLVASFYAGAVTAALLSTIAVFGVVATLFVSNIVKVTAQFTKFLFIYAISLFVAILLLMLLQVTGAIVVSYGISIVVCSLSTFLATLYLFFDLERIRQIVEGNYPKSCEWFVAFGLAFTVIWLYFQLLRLIVLIMDRR